MGSSFSLSSWISPHLPSYGLYRLGSEPNWKSHADRRLIDSGSVSDFFFTRPEPGNNSPIGEGGGGGGSGSGSATGSGGGIGRNRRISAERD